MTQEEDQTRKSVFLAVGIGAVAAVCLLLIVGWTLVQSVFGGLIVAIIFWGFSNRRRAVSSARGGDSLSRGAHQTTQGAPSSSSNAQQSSKPSEGGKKISEKTPAAPVEIDAVALNSTPATLDKPRESGSDDLKLIGGVGPKLEQQLNALGIWHFEQISGWGDSEIGWIDSRLKFKGRIKRDNWVEQAKILADGGETEFSRKKK